MAGVLKVIPASELARNLDPILKALEESGTSLIVKHHDQPAALLVRFDAYVAMLATMDYSGWERWIEDVRSAFPRAAFSPPRRPKSLAPAFIDLCENWDELLDGKATWEAFFPKLRSSGWKGYWVDAASALRMRDDAVIILDPVNMDVIKDALARGVRNYIGGNCTVSLMLMGMHGLFKADMVQWTTSMTYQAASGAGAEHVRELVKQMGFAHEAARSLLEDPASAILEVDRAVTAGGGFSERAVRLCACRQSSSVDRQGSRQRTEPRGVERAGGGQQDSGQERQPGPRRRDLRARRRDALPQPGAHGEAQARSAAR